MRQSSRCWGILAKCHFFRGDLQQVAVSMYHRLAGLLARGTYRAATRVYSTEVPKDAEVVVIGECELVQL